MKCSPCQIHNEMAQKEMASPFTTCHILTEQTTCVLYKHTYRFIDIFQLVSKDSYKDLLQDFVCEILLLNKNF